MNTLSKLLLNCLILVTFSVTSIFSQTTSKTFFKSFDIQGLTEVKTNFKGNIETKEWNEKYVRAQLNIEWASGSEAIMKSVVQKGRYNIIGKAEGNVFLINLPMLNDKLIINGKEIEEKISITFFLPKGVKLDANSTLLVTTKTNDFNEF